MISKVPGNVFVIVIICIVNIAPQLSWSWLVGSCLSLQQWSVSLSSVPWSSKNFQKHADASFNTRAHAWLRYTYFIDLDLSLAQIRLSFFQQHDYDFDLISGIKNLKTTDFNVLNRRLASIVHISVDAWHVIHCLVLQDESSVKRMNFLVYSMFTLSYVAVTDL